MARRSILRLAQIIKEKAAHVILHEIKDPRMGFVTVTRVELTDDLSFAEIFYSAMGTPVQMKLSRAALENARGYIQRRVAENLRTRIVPHIDLKFDESVVGQLHMSQLLKDLRTQREGEPGPDDAEDPGAAAGEAAADVGPPPAEEPETGSEPQDGRPGATPPRD